MFMRDKRGMSKKNNKNNNDNKRISRKLVKIFSKKESY